MIACKPFFPTYMAALNPTDQVFDFEELEYYYQVANRKEDIPSKDGWYYGIFCKCKYLIKSYNYFQTKIRTMTTVTEMNPKKRKMKTIIQT